MVARFFLLCVKNELLSVCKMVLGIIKSEQINILKAKNNAGV